MLTRNTFSKGLSPGWLLSSLHLQPFEGLRYHAADLSDFYHSFKVSRRRALRNRVRARFHAHELRGLSSFDPSLREPLGIGLNTLAMGDNLAVEVAQAAHTGLLRKLCGCMLPGEVLRYREPVPRGSLIEALAIDDHVCLQKLPLAELPFADDARDARIFGMAADAYAGVGLHQNRKKDKVKCTSGVVLGAELDGIKGVVCAPRERVHCLCMLTGFVARRGSCTPELLDSLLGCWIHVLLFRRPLFCIIDGLFGEGKGYGRTRVFRLSQKARNELFLLSVLGGLAQSDLRAQYHDSLFALDASPWGGAVCSAAVGAQASAELWRYGEQRGYYTRLASPASAVLLEHSIEHDGDRAFGDTTIGDTDHRAPLRPFNLTRPLAEGILYDAVELFRGVGNWSEAHAKVGLRVHSGLSAKTCKGLSADILDDAVCRDLMSLAARRVVREWHAGVPGHTYGTLRRPRLRSHACPFGFKPSDPLTLEHTRIARRAALILTLAVRCGQLISVEQPSGSCLYRLACFQRLASLGCVLTSFCFCSFGSPFRKRSLWLHNKPWVAELAGDCVCKWKGKHFSARGWHFDSKSVREFVSRCRPSCEAVYGAAPVPGQSVASFSGSYPKPLVLRMAAGSLAAKDGLLQPLSKDLQSATLKRLGVTEPAEFDCRVGAEEPFAARAWHEDPPWVSELCQSLKFRERFRYHFVKPGHINVNEARVYKSWIKSVAKERVSCRAVALLDSRVTIGAAAKGRSSSYAISRVLQGCLGYVLGSGIYPGLIHCSSGDNVADEPSRDKPVKAPLREPSRWITDLIAGNPAQFDLVVRSSELQKLPGL